MESEEVKVEAIEEPQAEEGKEAEGKVAVLESVEPAEPVEESGAMKRVENLEGNIEGGRVEDKGQEAQYPVVHICLRSGGNEVFKKSGISFDIANSLMEKEAAERIKINFYRQKSIATELSEMRQAPEINKRSKKVLIKKERAKLIKEQQNDFGCNVDRYNSKMHDSANLSHLHQKLRLKNFDGLNAEVMKDSMKIRENYKDVQKTAEFVAKDIASRSKAYEEKKLKHREEGKKNYEKQELEECTFKPKLYTAIKEQSQGLAISKHSKSGSLKVKEKRKVKVDKSQSLLATSMKELASRIPPPNKKHEKLAPVAEVGSSAIVTEKYAQLSPFLQNVRYKTGYNLNEIAAKGQPMVDYRQLVR